jgi:hypothetical protein
MPRRDKDEPPRKRFSKSGHTSHGPATRPPYGPAPQAPTGPAAAAPPPTAPRQAPSRQRPPAASGYPPGYGQPGYGPNNPASDYVAPPSSYPPGRAPRRDDGFSGTTYHQGGVPLDPQTGAAAAGGAAAPNGRRVTGAAKAAAVGTQRAAKLVTRKVISASEADGARESGLTALIWNQVLSYGTDAMITVALASTVFFGASTHAQRGNVLLYLLVTVAPFAVVAPVIGPALDRFQHGRRWAMGGTAIGRALLAIVMAGHPTSLLVLYPCALGSLVLSKAYSVVRAAAAPRLVPPGMTLVEANARLSIFGLGSAVVGGALVAFVVKITGSYSVGLWVTAAAFATCAFFAFRLPPQVDSASPAPRHPGEPARPRVQQNVPPVARLRSWARRGFPPAVITSLQGESALRFLSGLLTIFIAFYVEATRHGLDAALALGLLVGAAGVGNFLGTGLGARLRLNRPEVVIMSCIGLAAVTCLIVAIVYSVDIAVLGMLVSAAANSLAKIALDAVIQRDVPETLRSSGFARSETFLQLAWVIGAAIGCLLPSKNGSLGFWVGGVAAAAVTILVLLRNRVMNRTTSPGSASRPG